MKIKSIISAFLFLLIYGMNYAQCINAVDIPPTINCIQQTNSVSATTTTLWYKFEPLSLDEVFKFNLSPNDGTNVSSIQLYVGSDCSNIIPLTLFDSLNTNDSILMQGLNLNETYFLQVNFSNRLSVIDFTFCKSEKIIQVFWQNNFFINTPSGPLSLVDCSSGYWTDSQTSPTGSQYAGNANCQTPELCIFDTLFLELYDFDAASFSVFGLFEQDFWFENANGANYTQLSPILGMLTFTQNGPVSFHCGPDSISVYTEFPYATQLNYPNYVFNLNITSAPPSLPGLWENNDTICISGQSTFQYFENGQIISAQVDGGNVFFNQNTLVFNGTDYSAGTHTLTYTVQNSCGIATFTSTFVILDLNATSFMVDNCGNAVLTFTTCEDQPTNTQYYTITWGDGTIQNGSYSGTGFTLTHNYPPGSYSASFLTSFLPNGLGGIIYDEIFAPVTIQLNVLTLTGPLYNCEITSPISIITPANFTNVVWSTVPVSLPFTGQGTPTMNPNQLAWAGQNQDIVVNVTAIDENGCQYTGIFTLLECCKPVSTPANEFFEQTYYTHSDLVDGLQNKLPASAYNGPTSVAINLPTAPALPIISTAFSFPTTMSAFLLANAGATNITVAGASVTINRIVYINNMLVIDQNTNIINSNYLRFGPNGGISINAGVTLNLNNSTLAPYCGQMWKGIIHNQNSALLNLLNTNIVGAEGGVQVTGNGGFKIEASRFIDNLVGVSISNRNTINNQLISMNYFGDVEGIPLLFPYANLNTTFVGIYILNSQNMIVGSDALVGNVGGGNMFKRIKEGVRINNSQVYLTRNTFYKIYEGLLLSDFGIGVNILANKLFLSDVTIGSSITAYNVFYSCEKGVRDDGLVNLKATSNLMKDIKFFGFELFAYSSSTNHLIQNNSLNSTSNRVYGVYVKDFGNATNLIQANTFNVNIGPALPLAYDFRTAIHIGNINATVVNNSQVLNNVINYSRIGIHVLNTYQAKVKSNTINMDWANTRYTSVSPFNAVTSTGILFQNSSRNQIWSNFISHNTLPIGITQERLIGIRIELSPYSYVWKNSMTRLASGFYALGSNFRSRVECNNLQQNNQGFQMTNADIGRQGAAPAPPFLPNGLSAHNRWVSNIGADGTRGTMLYPVGATPVTQYYHNPGALFNSDPSSVINSVVNGWTDIILTSGATTCGAVFNFSPINLEPEEKQREADFNELAQNTALYSVYDKEMRHYLHQHAYGHLKHNPSAVNLGVSSDAYYQNYISTTAPIETKLQVEVADYLANKEAILAANTINQYASTEVFDLLLKDVQQIWNNAVLNNTVISTSDSIYLYSIACSDPMENGSAVYVARNILDWDGTCPTNGNKSGEQTSENNETILFAESFSLYPVPNKGDFTILANETISQIEIYDLNGKLLESYNEINSEQINLNTKLVSGLYLISVKLESKKLETLRFVIE